MMSQAVAREVQHSKGIIMGKIKILADMIRERNQIISQLHSIKKLQEEQIAALQTEVTLYKNLYLHSK